MESPKSARDQDWLPNIDVILSINKKEVKPEEILHLYEDAGLASTVVSLEMVQVSIAKSALIITARLTDGTLVGFAKVLTDGVFYTTVAEIVVHSAWQRRGIGRRIMDRVKELCTGTPVVIDCFQQNIPFFESCGYVQRRGMAVFTSAFVPSWRDSGNFFLP